MYFARGNITALVYNRAHFLQLCNKCTASALVCCWTEWWKPNDELRRLGRASLR